jgi:hypothetical protein
MSRHRRLILLILLLSSILLPLLAVAGYFHIVLPTSAISVSDPAAHAYILNDNYILLVWRDLPFMIYPKEKWIGQLSDYRNRFMGKQFWSQTSSLIFWPRGSYASVPLGDGVKRDHRESYEFTSNKIRVRAYFYADAQFHEIQLKFRH